MFRFSRAINKTFAKGKRSAWRRRKREKKAKNDEKHKKIMKGEFLPTKAFLHF